LTLKKPSVVEDTMELIIQRGLEHRSIVGAVPRSANLKLLELKPKFVPCCPDYLTMVKLMACYYLGTLKDCYIPHEIVGFPLIGVNILSKELISELHQLNKKVIVFGTLLNDETVIENCLDYGVDLFVVDRPDLLSEVLEEFKKKQKNTDTIENNN